MNKAIWGTALTLFSLSASVGLVTITSHSALANPGDYAIQPVCPRHQDSSGTICYTPQTVPRLKVGSQGKLVKIVQDFLKAEGYFKGQSSGYFGSQTKTALTKFQKANRLTADGIVGTQTWKMILKANAG
jgi:peptidoglycan hydrolase-like protein with peptidoglycan-binding domain